MRVELSKPLTKRAQIRVTYNNLELITKDFADGETPNFEFETPNESGVAKAYLLFEGEPPEVINKMEFICDDLRGANMLLTKLVPKERFRSKRARILRAIAILKKILPDSDLFAEAHLHMVWAYFALAERRGPTQKKNQKLTLMWYETVLRLYEKNGNFRMVGAHSTNSSVVYLRYGDANTAHARAMRGLRLAKAHGETDPERLSAWTHAVSRSVSVNKLDLAERIIKDGLKRFDSDAHRAYLLQLQASVCMLRAKECRQKADALLPPGPCPLR